MFLANTFRAFRHRDYAIFWWSLLVGNTTGLIQTTAQAWLIFQLTHSAFYLGLDGLCLGLPRVIFSPIGGAVVDRTNRRIVFIITQSAFLLMTLFLGVMDYTHLIRVWHILTVSAFTGFFLAFEQPVRQSIVHHLVPRPELPNAITLYQMVFNGSALFGPGVGGALIPIIGTSGCFFADAVGSLIGIVTIFLIAIPPTAVADNRTSIAKDTLNGLRLAWKTPFLLSIFAILGVVTFCTKPYTQFMPIFAEDILKAGAPGLGLLLMAPGAGAIVGGLSLASLTRFPRPHHLLLFLSTGFGVSIVGFAGSRILLVSLVLLFFAGAFQTTFLSFVATLLQINSDETNRGRMMSLFGLINRGLGPMGSFPFGMLAAVLGAPLTVAICGCLTVGLVGYVVFARPQLRESRGIDEM